MTRMVPPEIASAGPSTIPVTLIQAPNGPRIAQLLTAIRSALGQPAARRETTAQLRAETYRIMRAVGLRLLLIDDMHNMSASGVGPLLVELREIGSLGGVSLGGFATKDIAYAMRQDEQLANRFDLMTLPRWRIDDPDYWRLLHTLGRRLPLRAASDLTDPALASHIMLRSDGLIGAMTSCSGRLPSRQYAPRMKGLTAPCSIESPPPRRHISRRSQPRNSFDVVDFDLEAACLVRLRQELDTLLAHVEPECRERIMAMVCRRPREGLEIMPQLRAALGPQLQRWPAPVAIRGEHTRPADNAGLEAEPLAAQPVATLWPYRPKRQPDELFSSWLWRVARGIGAPPRRFAQDVLGAHLTDIDRTVSDTAIERLAFQSGQTREHLLRGTLRPDVAADPADLRGRVQQRLLRHGDLVLNRLRRGRRGGIPVLQYCPVCLRRDRAFLRRGWRFQPGGCLLRGWMLSARRLLAVRRPARSFGAERAVGTIPVHPMRRTAGKSAVPVHAGQRRRPGRALCGIGSACAEARQRSHLARR